MPATKDGHAPCRGLFYIRRNVMKMFGKRLPRLRAAMTARFAAMTMRLVVLAFCAALAFCFASCSNDSEPPIIMPSGTQTTGGGSETTSVTTPTETGGQTPAPVPATIYTITFNANDGSENPATVPQNFTAGIPQALTPVEELGFFKEGFIFAGWGTAPKSRQASYADGASYTATAPATLYALWSEIPVYSVNIPVNENGSVTATPATGTAGTEITLLAAPKAGYEFGAFTVVDADNNALSVTDGKFTMPEKNVTVTAAFNAINYAVNVGTFANGSVAASPTTATVGTEITLSNTPNAGYKFVSYTVTAADGTAVAVTNGKFTMPAKNVSVAATFSAINYAVSCGTFANGSVEASPATATVGTRVTLTARPNSGYQLGTLTVTDAGGASVSVTGTGNTRTFTMPAKNVTVTATFEINSSGGASIVNTYVSAKVDVRYDSAAAYKIGSTFERIDLLSDGKITSFIVGSLKSDTINMDDNSHQLSSGTYSIADGKLTFTLYNETKTYNINDNGDLTDNRGDIQFNLANASGKLYANAVTKLDGNSSYAQVRVVWLKDDSGKTGQLMDIKITKNDTSKTKKTKDVTYEISGNTVTLTFSDKSTKTATLSDGGKKLTLDGDVYLKM